MSDLNPVVNIWPMPHVSIGRVQLYLAPYSAHDKIVEGGGAHGENVNITVQEFGLDELRDMVVIGPLVDEKTLILAQALLL